MADTTFLIAAYATGADPDMWTKVEDLLSAVSPDITLRALEWDFRPYVAKSDLLNGHDFGRGYASARWSFGALRPEQRENLKDFCAGLSEQVYIRTPTNETVAGVRTWGDYLGIMHWTPGAELVSVNAVEQVEIIFTHLEVV